MAVMVRVQGRSRDNVADKGEVESEIGNSSPLVR